MRRGRRSTPEQPAPLIAWTGERCVPWTDNVQVVYEHLHRYYFAAELAHDRRVLDLGSGEGYGSAVLAERARKVVGLELDDLSVRHSRERYPAANLEFLHGDARQLERHFSAGSFDLVVCFEVVEHLREQSALLAGIAHVLGHEGLLVLSTPNRAVYNEALAEPNPFHARELDQEELVALLREHFSSVSLWGQTLITGSYIGRSRAADERGQGFRIAVDEAGGRWLPASEYPATYLLAVASASKLPPLPDLSVLVDRRLALLGESLLEAARLERENAALAARAGGVEAQLELIYATRGWRALQVYRRTRAALSRRSRREPR